MWLFELLIFSMQASTSRPLKWSPNQPASCMLCLPANMSLNPNNNRNAITNNASNRHHDLFKPLQTNTKRPALVGAQFHAMGTFLGHFLPGLAFAILGVWHLLNTIKGYKLKGASGFCSATWFPFPSPVPGLRRLELYLLLSFSVLAIVDQLVDLPILALCLQPDSLEHATMYLHLAVYASVALAADVVTSRRRDAAATPTPGGAGVGDVVTALAASVFGQELFLLRFHSADHAGLEGHYHWLLQLVVAASVVTTAASAVLPRNFAVAVVRSASVLLQGVWFMVMGFALWVPALVPAGCRGGVEGSAAAMRSAVACATEEAARRAVVMANLQFSWALAAVWVVTAYLCLRVDYCRCLDYMQLQTPHSGGVGAGDGDATPPQKHVFPVEEHV